MGGVMQRRLILVGAGVLFLALFTLGVFSNIYHHKESLPVGLVTQTAFLPSPYAESNLVTTEVGKPPAPDQESQLQESLSSEERRELLLREAVKRKITVANDTVDTFLTTMKTVSGLDDAAFRTFLTDNGYTLEEYREEVSNALAISQLLEQELHLSEVQASDREVEGVIDQNHGEFAEIIEIDPDMEEYLRNRVQRTLTREKQEELVEEYLETLE